MPSTVEKLSPTRVKLTVEIPFTDLKPHLDKAYKDIAEQVNIPGFRKGKVPAAVIDQRFGRGVVLQEAINDAIPPAYNAAIDEAKVIPMAQPDEARRPDLDRAAERRQQFLAAFERPFMRGIEREQRAIGGSRRAAIAPNLLR